MGRAFGVVELFHARSPNPFMITDMKNARHWITALLVGAGCGFASVAGAETIGCVTTAWKLIGANHRVCVEAFGDPKVPGVTCHVSQARTGGISGSLGLAEDPSQFSLACRQTGPIALPANLPKDEVVFSEDTSILFKETRVVRLWDAQHRTLVYVGISRKLVEGAPANSISTVPVMPWR
jgi:CreA protein